jgi:hypothetical protein
VQTEALTRSDFRKTADLAGTDDLFRDADLSSRSGVGPGEIREQPMVLSVELLQFRVAFVKARGLAVVQEDGLQVALPPVPAIIDLGLEQCLLEMLVRTGTVSRSTVTS